VENGTKNESDSFSAYQQIIFIIKNMILAKRRVSLEPIRTHHTKASSNSIGNIQRAASSRPATDNKSKPPSALANLLPLIKPPTNNKKQLRPL
jgi:hypothetical protein